MKNFLKSLIIIFTSILLVTTLVEGATNNIFQSGGNVGIGTTTPFTNLSVQGQIYGDGTPIYNLQGPNIQASTTESSNFGDYFTRNFGGTTASSLKGNASTTVVAFVGDSWTAGNKITDPLRTTLQNIFGNGGPGYASIGSLDGPTSAIVIASTGTWNTLNQGVLNQTSYGIDLYEASSTDTATPASKTVTAKATDFVIHYIAQSGGGSFTYAVDGGSATTINTDNAGVAAYATTSVNVDTVGSRSHAIKLTVTVAGTKGVTILGVDVQINSTLQPVLRIEPFGHSGAKAGDYNTFSTNQWQSGLASVNPGIVFIMIGVNDMNSVVGTSTYKTNMQTLINSVKAAVPNADIVLFGQGDSGYTNTKIADYDNVEHDLARTNNAGFIDGVKALGAFNNNAYGYWTPNGGVHPSFAGGQALADLALRFLVPYPPRDYASIGINNPTPIYPLDIVGFAGASTTPVIRISTTTDGTTLKNALVIDGNGNTILNGNGAISGFSVLTVNQNGTAPGLTVQGGTNPDLRVTDGTLISKIQSPTGGSFGLFGTESNHPLRLYTNNTAKVTIDTSGNMSVGTTTFYNRFNVWGAGTGTGQTFAVINNASTTILQVLDNGKVGINTTNPTGSLQVVNGSSGGTTDVLDISNPFTANNTCARINWNFSTTLSAYQAYEEGCRSNSPANGGTYLDWATNNGTALGERMRLSEVGNLGIGTTSPWAKLSVNGQATDTGGQPLFVVASSTAAFATTTDFLITNTGVTSIGTTTTQGILNLGTNPTSTNGSTTISVSKLQWDGYDAGGTRRCTFINSAGAVTVIAGACNP